MTTEETAKAIVMHLTGRPEEPTPILLDMLRDFRADRTPMTGKVQVVSVSRITFNDLMDKIGAENRFTNVQQWTFPHFWLYSPGGSVVVFTSEPIHEIESRRLLGEF